MTPISLYPDEVTRLLKEGKLTIARPVDKYINDEPDAWNFIKESKSQPGCFRFRPYDHCETIIKSPYGKVGDELYGQEEFAFHRCWDKWSIERLAECGHDDTILYLADGESLVLKTMKRGPITAGIKRESSTMPRWASRLPLINRGTTVKRVQDVTNSEASKFGYKYQEEKNSWLSAGYVFKQQWQSRHPDHPWADNPFSWFIKLEIQA